MTPEQSELVVSHRGVARHFAWQQYRRSAGFLELDECRAVADEALCLLAVEWDAGKGASFRTYAFDYMPARMIDVARAETGRRRPRSIVADVSLDAPPPFQSWGPGAGSRRRLVSETADSRLASMLAVDDLTFAAVEAAASIAAVARTDQERTILVALGAGKSLREAGGLVGVTESRACQIRRELRERYYAATP